MRRINWKTVSTLVAMGMLAGCSESIVNPGPSALAPETASMASAPKERPTMNVAGIAAANDTSTFSVGPRGGIFLAGNAAVYFPPNSICDPEVSGYGPGTWDEDCRTLTSEIKITAVTRVTGGSTQVDFAPELRFAPSSNPKRWVWLYMSVPSLAGTRDLDAFKIFYAPTLDGPLVDESVTDPTLRTFADSRTGVSLRRVKHFSGYTITTGRSCNPNVETCE